MSHPTRVRGLKPTTRISAHTATSVAPHAGAWIETYVSSHPRRRRPVAPHAGAWIETSLLAGISRTTKVAPHAGAWIETLPPVSSRAARMASHPTRVRGLKPGLRVERLPKLDVAPHAGAWIETNKVFDAGVSDKVAPHAGAWIETSCPASACRLGARRTPRGCVD